MKQTITLAAILIFAVSAHAQDTTYNRFSLDAQFGVNNPISPMSDGYDAPTFGLFHVGLGGRYMFNPKFGLRLSGGYDQFSAADGSLAFKTDYYRTTLEGVVNLGNVLDFDQWTKHFGILLHTGMGYSTMLGRDSDNERSHMINVVAGITPQVKLGERWNIYADVSATAHIYQEFAYDYTRKIPDRGVDGYLYNFSLGLQYNFGKHTKHADWVSVSGMNEEQISALRQRVRTLEDQQRDDDGDGVANYLDQEPGTPAGTEVDTKGRTVVRDSDMDGIPDVNDDCPFEKGIESKKGCPERSSGMNSGMGNGSGMSTAAMNMIESSEVKFETDMYNINSSFAAMLDGIAGVMKENPSQQLNIIGHADDRGSTEYNQTLSENRAQAVKDYLVSKGVASNRLTTIGVGETKPKIASQSVESRAENRRVQFILN